MDVWFWTGGVADVVGGDGLKNLAEYILGLDALAPNDAGWQVASLAAVSDSLPEALG